MPCSGNFRYADVDISHFFRRVGKVGLEAILLQLWRKELGGNRQALAVRLKYEELIPQKTETRTEITFVDSPYTQSCGHIPSSGGDGDDKV